MSGDPVGAVGEGCFRALEGRHIVATIDEEQRLSDPADAGDLHQFGYVQSLRRTIGPFASFAVAFSMVSITTAIFFLLPSLFGTSGAAGVWLWLPCAGGVFLIVLVYAHLAARIPITGFAYQWNSRLINSHYGWFTGYTALLAFMAGTAATAVAQGEPNPLIESPLRSGASGALSVTLKSPLQVLRKANVVLHPAHVGAIKVQQVHSALVRHRTNDLPKSCTEASSKIGCQEQVDTRSRSLLSLAWLHPQFDRALPRRGPSSQTDSIPMREIASASS